MQTFFALATLFAGAMAQGLTVVQPTSGSTIAAGQSFRVQLNQANSATDNHQVNVTIALASCGGVCPDDPTQWPLSEVLYLGPFNPQYDPANPQLGLYQNFTLDMPEGYAGDTVLNVYHLELVGVEQDPYVEFKAVHVNVTA